MNKEIFLFEGLNEETFSRYLESMAVNILSGTPVPLVRVAVFPDKPGVYCIFENDILIYVGETGSLKERMRDIFQTKNHTFRRALGKKLYSDNAEVKLVGPKTNFPFEIEISLTEYMESNLKIVAVPIVLGRKEIEEKICTLHKTLLNTKMARGSKT